MPAAYSNDFRQKMVECYEQGQESQASVAQRFSVSVSCFKRLWKRYQGSGSVSPGRMGGWVKPKVDEAGAAYLRQQIEQASDLTLAELCECYEERFHVKLSTSSMDRALKRLGMRYKKNSLRPKKTDRAHPKAQEPLSGTPARA